MADTSSNSSGYPLARLWNKPRVGKPFAPKRRRTQVGSLFIESLMSVFVLSMGAVAFFSLMPTMQRSQKIARGEQVAIQLCNRMVEHIQLLKVKDVNAETLAQLNLIDQNQPSTSYYTFTNVPLDDASNYSPAKMLHNADARFTVSTLSSGSKRIVMTISWDTESGNRSTIQTGTVIGGYR